MASRPPKRRRRLIVLSSDDDEKSTTPDHHIQRKENSSINRANAKQINSQTTSVKVLPTRLRRKTRSLLSSKPCSTSSITKDPPSSVENVTRKRLHSEKKDKSASLYAYYGLTDFPQQSLVNPLPVENKPEAEVEPQDLIEDDSDDYFVQNPSSSQNPTRSVLDRRKKQPAPTQSQAFSECTQKFPRTRQKFIVQKEKDEEIPRPKQNKDRKFSSYNDMRPWAEKYGPNNMEELMVHKKKIADVKNWLEMFWQGQDQKRLLILKGPSGAGKTATVTALANAMSLDISEWKNPIDSNFSSEGYVSMSAQFEDFLGRSGKFGSLEFFDNGSREVLKPPASHTPPEITRKKVVLLEEFPSILTSTSIALKAFRSSILSYLAVSTFPNSLILTKQDSVQKSSPVIMIITETSLNSEITSNDSFSAHRLLGPDILNHRAASVIEFNPVAPTYLAKALDLVIKKEARQSGRRRIPGAAVLKQLGENGDIRSAIGSLEFLCLKGNDGDDWGSSVAIKAKKGSNNSTVLTEIEKKSLEMITRREAALGIFHAVGKVVYNKRDEIRMAIPTPDPPDQLPDHRQHTSMVSQVSPDQLINETGTDTRTFIAALHENYIMSCEGLSFTESFNGSIDALSDSDLLSSNQGQGSRFGRGLYQGGGASDSMRQDEICFHIAVRGILFALPYPVKRRAFPSGVIGKNGGKRDAFKMFYPTSLRLSKKQEEVEFLVDQWASQHSLGLPLQGLPTAKSTFATPASSDDTSWERKSLAYHNTHQTSDLYPEEKNTVPKGMKSPQIELILETLPYVTQIIRCGPEVSNIEQLEKVTRFHGIAAPTDDISEDEDMNMSLESAISQPQVIAKSVLGIDSKQKGTQQEPQILGLSHLAQTGTEKLWLSDDDIED